MVSEITATLENWYIDTLTFRENVVMGNIYNDVRGRFPDGYPIHTSRIDVLDLKEGDIVRTENSVYKLGESAPQTVTEDMK